MTRLIGKNVNVRIHAERQKYHLASRSISIHWGKQGRDIPPHSPVQTSSLFNQHLARKRCNKTYNYIMNRLLGILVLVCFILFFLSHTWMLSSLCWHALDLGSVFSHVILFMFHSRSENNHIGSLLIFGLRRFWFCWVFFVVVFFFLLVCLFPFIYLCIYSLGKSVAVEIRILNIKRSSLLHLSGFLSYFHHF